jgi:hypothetical protein
MGAIPLSNTDFIRNEQYLCNLEWFRSGPSIGVLFMHCHGNSTERAVPVWEASQK